VVPAQQAAVLQRCEATLGPRLDVVGLALLSGSVAEGVGALAVPYLLLDHPLGDVGGHVPEPALWDARATSLWHAM
jgi:hypothetical protein